MLLYFNERWNHGGFCSAADSDSMGVDQAVANKLPGGAAAAAAWTKL